MTLMPQKLIIFLLHYYNEIHGGLFFNRNVKLSPMYNSVNIM